MSVGGSWQGYVPVSTTTTPLTVTFSQTQALPWYFNFGKTSQKVKLKCEQNSDTSGERIL